MSRINIQSISQIGHQDHRSASGSWLRTAQRITVFALTAVMLIGCTRQKPAATVLTPERRELHLQSFDQVWTTVRDQHWDKTLNGVDWNAAKEELRPKVEAAQSDAEARAAMNELIGRLNQSHFSIIPAESYERLDDLPGRSAASAKPGFSGIHLRPYNDEAIVIKVEPGSAGESAGVQPGWILTKVGKFHVAKVLERVRIAYGKSSLLSAYESLTLNGLLEGDEGEALTTTFRDGNDKVVKKSITLAAPTGTPANFMNLPTFYITSDMRTIEPNIGYVTFSAFFDPPNVSVKFREFIDNHRDMNGLIIDLRGNPGGIGFMANGMAGSLVDTPNLKLGEMTMRTATVSFAINPQPVIFTGPVAILVDGASMSTSEIMAGGMQDIGRARIFGTATPGAALPSRVEKLPNGDGFQYAFANYVSAKGAALEGKGVTPDEIVEIDRKALLAGRDAVIDAAVAWIQAQKK